jgi:hypothetical protein
MDSRETQVKQRNDGRNIPSQLRETQLIPRHVVGDKNESLKSRSEQWLEIAVDVDEAEEF